jgi:hypothetical protein
VPSGETQLGAGRARSVVPGVEPLSWRTASGRRGACRVRSQRISPLVGRRDPLGVGLRPGDQAGSPRRAGAPVSRPTARRWCTRSWPAGRSRLASATRANVRLVPALGLRPTRPRRRCRPGTRFDRAAVSRPRR